MWSLRPAVLGGTEQGSSMPHAPECPSCSSRQSQNHSFDHFCEQFCHSLGFDLQRLVCAWASVPAAGV